MLTAATADLCGNPTAFPAAARVLLAISATAPPARESEGSRFPLSILSASLACSGVEMKGGFLRHRLRWLWAREGKVVPAHACGTIERAGGGGTLGNLGMKNIVKLRFYEMVVCGNQGSVAKTALRHFFL